MWLIKYFLYVQEDDWRKEVELVKELSDGDGYVNIFKYCWYVLSMENIMFCFYYEILSVDLLQLIF